MEKKSEKELKELIKEVMQESEKDTDKDAKPEKKVEARVEAKELVEKIGQDIAKAIAEARKESDVDKTAEQIKSELFSYEGGMQAISYPSAKELSELEDDAKMAVFFKALVYKNTDTESDRVFKALVEGTAGYGGYLVPAPLATEIWRVLPDMSVMRKIARTVPMTAQTLKLNSLEAKPAAYWTSEYASKTTSSAEFDQVTLTARKLAAILPIADELVADANVDIVRYMISIFAEVFAAEEDRTFFTGNGTTQPRGINQETLTSVAAGGALSMDHVIALIDSVPQSARLSGSTAFVGHSYVKRLCRNLKDSNNNYIWRDSSVGRMSGQTERLPDTLYGIPLYEQNDLSQSELYFGAWVNYIIGDRQQITVDTTREGGDAWRRDSTEIRVVERVDGRAVLTAPFAKITGI